jgi:threonine/homoserine/homoserine lactone efflux protein
MTVALLVGFLFGFLGSIPVAGPLAAIVLARAMAGRDRSALFIALGGGLAEGLYAWLACFGFTALLARYSWLAPASELVATLILTGLGLLFLLKPPEPRNEADATGQEGSDLLLGFTLVALNPTLIATWTAATTVLLSTGLVSLDGSTAAWFAGGAWVGIVAWFVALIVLVRRYRERFNPQQLKRFLRAMGVFLLGVAAWFLYRLLKDTIV